MRPNARTYATAFLEAAEKVPHHALPALAGRLVTVLTRRRQRKLIPNILHLIDEVWDERHGITQIRVTTALARDEWVEKRLGNELTELSVNHNQALIAGAIIERGDERIDASVATRLTRLKEHLIRQ